MFEPVSPVTTARTRATLLLNDEAKLPTKNSERNISCVSTARSKAASASFPRGRVSALKRRRIWR